MKEQGVHEDDYTHEKTKKDDFYSDEKQDDESHDQVNMKEKLDTLNEKLKNITEAMKNAQQLMNQ
jgi:hypothetical protein